METFVLGSAVKLTAIPPDLYSAFHTSDTWYVPNFNGSFKGTAITEVPSGLFDYALLTSSFDNTFENTAITTVPSDLFANNTKTTCNFRGTFKDCTSLTSDITGWFGWQYLSTADTNNRVDNIFNGCVNVTGDAYDFWNNTTPPIYKQYTFANCTSLNNYDDIPDDWKGL